jgi:DNA-binding transcriptional ArsR family regulator
MAVRFQLPSERPVGLVGFGWSPLVELAVSMRPLVNPKRVPMHLPWARRCRDLPDDLLADIRLFSGGPDAFYLPGVYEVGLQGDLPTFEDELGRLAAIDDELLQHEMSLVLGGVGCQLPDHGQSVAEDRAVVHEPRYVDQVLDVARDRGPAHAELTSLLFDDPAAFRARMVAMVERYWELAFAEEWERVRPRIEAEVTDGARTLVTTGMPGLVAGFLPEGEWDADTTSITVDKTWRQTCDVAERGGMLFVPTVYGWPNVLIELARPWPVAVFFPLRDLRQPEVPQASDHEVADGLRALGDETRLQITRLVAEEPRSTKELASLLSLSESAVSRHLKTLASAGVVDSERDGYFVLYRLVPDRIGALGGALRRTLGLAQATTGRVPALPVSVARQEP